MDEVNVLREALLIAQADIESLRTAITALASQQSGRDAALEVFDAQAAATLDVHREAVRRRAMQAKDVLALEQAFRHTRLCLS